MAMQMHFIMSANPPDSSSDTVHKANEACKDHSKEKEKKKVTIQVFVCLVGWFDIQKDSSLLSLHLLLPTKLSESSPNPPTILTVACVFLTLRTVCCLG